jgi:hypothetical protein
MSSPDRAELRCYTDLQSVVDAGVGSRIKVFNSRSNQQLVNTPIFSSGSRVHCIAHIRFLAQDRYLVAASGARNLALCSMCIVPGSTSLDVIHQFVPFPNWILQVDFVRSNYKAQPPSETTSNAGGYSCANRGQNASERRECGSLRKSDRYVHTLHLVVGLMDNSVEIWQCSIGFHTHDGSEFSTGGSMPFRHDHLRPSVLQSVRIGRAACSVRLLLYSMRFDVQECRTASAERCSDSLIDTQRYTDTSRGMSDNVTVIIASGAKLTCSC